MKVNELMIGDWVMFPNSIEKVQEISYVCGKGYCASFAASATLFPISIDKIKPIPLTPEILEKNGFITEEREGDPTFPYLAFIIENDEYRIEITWYDSHDVYEPNTGEYLHGAPEFWNMDILGKCGNYDCGKNKLYLHEFQHALKLCGIEKNIII